MGLVPVRERLSQGPSDGSQECKISTYFSHCININFSS